MAVSSRICIPGPNRRTPGAHHIGSIVLIRRDMYRGGWSMEILDEPGRRKMIWPVVSVAIMNCTFHIGMRGRRRSIFERHRNTGIFGTLTSYSPPIPIGEWEKVFYDPYIVPGFRVGGPYGIELTEAREVRVFKNQIWADTR